MVGNGISSGTHVLPPKDGTSGQIVIPDTLTAKSTPSPVPAPGTNANAGASFSVWPVTITGTTPVGGSQALTGQQLTAVLNVPPGFSVYQPTGQTGYQWTITGSLVNKVFKNYDPTLPSNQLTLLTAADLTAASPSFYDSAAETVSATCAVTLVAPDGTKLPLTVKSKDISVLKPTVTAWGITTGFVQPKPNAVGVWGLEPDPSTTNSDGETWANVTIVVPSPFVGGQGTFTQLLTPDRETYTGTTPTPTVPNNNQIGLDGSFEYGSPWTVPAMGNDVDSPAITISGGNPNNTLTKLTAHDILKTWVMYNPPAVGSQNTVWVPLANYTWSWSGTVSWLNNQWTLTAGTPANAASEPHYIATSTPDPPQWMLIH